MKLYAFTTKNVLSGLFAGIDLFPTETQASVSISDGIVNSKQSLSDYELYKVGEFDSETNRLIADEIPTKVEWDKRHHTERAVLEESVKKIVSDMLTLK